MDLVHLDPQVLASPGTTQIKVLKHLTLNHQLHWSLVLFTYTGLLPGNWAGAADGESAIILNKMPGRNVWLDKQ